MPVTRSLATKIARRVVIPARNDISLVQKRGNCIEGLATALFQIIQQFLSEYDYCQLMNTNLSTFQPIKYETIQYSISANNSDLCEAYNEMVALQMIASVKDKFKQITVRLSNVDEKLIGKYAKLYDGVATLYLTRFTFPFNTMPFQLFTSITHLTLTDGNVYSVVDFNLENLRTLIIWNCNFTGISSWNPSSKLQSVTITSCRWLRDIPPLDNIKIVDIDSCYNLTKFQTTGGHAKFSFVGYPGEYLSPESYQCMVQPSFYEGLDHLILDSQFPSKFLGFSLWKNITSVFLTTNRRNIHSFPLFFGVELRLENFTLSAWNDCKELPNLERCVLTDCEGFHIFPASPVLTSLRVESCSDLKTIPSLPTLRVLNVQSCPLLEKIDDCPILTTAIIYDCTSLRDFTLCLSLKFLRISDCKMLKTLHVSPAAEIINGETGPISNSNLQTKCCLLLGPNLPSMKKFAFCQNIYQVELTEMDTLVSLQGFHNISGLKITGCPNLITTKGIGKILKRITFEDCPRLIRLVGLQGIPEVFLDDCDDIVNFTGLGNHELLALTPNMEFSKLLKEHEQNKLLHSEIFSNTKAIRGIKRYKNEIPCLYKNEIIE
jgi:hypothetical protein